MKIVLTVHQFLPDYSAGTEVLTLGTARELRKRGHEVTVFTGYPAQVALEDEQRFDSYEFEGIPVHRFHHAYVPMAGQQNVQEAEYNNHLFGRYFREALLQLQPDVLHFFHLGRLSASAVEVGHELQIPMALTPTDFWFVCPMNQLRLPDNSMCLGPNPNGVNCLRHIVSLNQPAALRASVESLPDFALAGMIQAIDHGFFSKSWFFPHVRALYRRPAYLRERINFIDRVIVPTRLMETILKENGLRAEKIIFSPYGIDLTSIPPVPHRYGPKLRLGFMGTLYEHKGVHVAIHALRSLPAAHDLELKIYGKLNEFPDYVSQIKEMAAGDPRIHFCGTFPNHEIGGIFEELDALLVPSVWYENTPLVIYSAQAARCPVIASNLGGMAEAIHNEMNGLLFQPGDAAGLARILERIYDDRSILPRLAQNAVPPKSIARYAEELEGIYRRMEPKPGPSQRVQTAR